MLIDGRAIAQKIKDKIKVEVAALPFQPLFCDILVGDDPVSVSYVNMKAKAAESLGMKFLRAEFPESISDTELIEEIIKINRTQNLCGLIVQLPLPNNLNREKVVSAIEASLDVDCLSRKNLDLFYEGKFPLVPPTPGAVIELLDSVLDGDPGKKIVVVGQGELVGRPVTYLLKQRGFEVRVIDKDTLDPESIASQCDVIITAAGRPKLITDKWIKPGAIVIDAGTAESDGGIVGDVDFTLVEPKVSYISPVPGGVGPVTVAKLLENVVKVAKSRVTK